MKERPILFSGPMVQAILRGEKTQTRRVVTSLGGNRGGPVAPAERSGVHYWRRGEEDSTRWCGCDGLGSLGWVRCPYGDPGDRLWVRETWCPAPRHSGPPREMHPHEVAYRATQIRPRCRDCADNDGVCELDGLPCDPPWRPSIHMPRWASRLTLEVVDVRVERLTVISEEDARAEGLVRHACGWAAGGEGYDTLTARQAFEELWNSINGERPGCAWADDPWVWVVNFRVEGGCLPPREPELWNRTVEWVP